MAREFVARDVTPFAAAWDRDEALDPAIAKKLASAGFLGCVIPEAYGGMGLDSVSYCIITEELGRGDSSVRGIVSVNLGLVGKTILKWGSEEQKQRWLQPLCAGEGLGCFGLTEPGSGSDPGSLQTRARRDGDDWLISGTKIFITGGLQAQIALIFARTSDDARGAISCFVVRTDAPNFSRVAINGKLGLRAQDTAELVLDEVRVSDADRLGPIGKGMSIALSALDSGRMGLAAGCVGIAQGCIDASLKYAAERQQFGGPIARFQLVQELIADMAVETQAARLLTWQCATMEDAGVEHTLASSFAKYFASETAVRAANAAVQVHGGYGYVDEYPVGKYLRDARVTTLYEGTSQIHKLLIGRALTGVSAFT